MNLKFLGVGGAFSLDHFQSNMIFTGNDGKRLLIDAGGDIRHSLRAAGLTHKDVDAAYISHVHADHCMGLEYIGLYKYNWDTHGKPTMPLFVRHELVSLLWDALKIPCGTVAGVEVSLESFFKCMPLMDHETFEFGGTTFRPIRTMHYHNGHELMPSFGLFLHTTAKNTCFITTDTMFLPEFYYGYYKAADVIFHDCYTAGPKCSVHATYEELKTLPAEIRKKMFLYHYSDGTLPDAKADGFAGFVKQGEEFVLDLTAGKLRGQKRYSC